jgi:hypothetical protein
MIVLALSVTSANRNAEAVQRASHRADAQLVKETEVRTRDLCQVVVNVHQNAVFRYRTEKVNLKNTIDYIKAIGPPKTELDRRIESSLSITRARVYDAKRGVKATAVPNTCKPYSPTIERPGSDRAQN